MALDLCKKMNIIPSDTQKTAKKTCTVPDVYTALEYIFQHVYRVSLNCLRTNNYPSYFLMTAIIVIIMSGMKSRGVVRFCD